MREPFSFSAHPPAPGFRRLFEPITIGCFEVRNRLVNTTHGSRLSESRDLRYLRERARGGAGLIGLHGSTGVASYAVGPGPASGTPDWDEKQVSPATSAGIRYFDNIAIPYMRKRADVVHAEGARCFAQVFHLGAAAHDTRVSPPVAPSSVADPYEAIAPHPLTSDEIEEVIVAFAHGIRRIREAGVDAAEIHGAHGYLVHQFLSPRFNRRTDQWGGTRGNRARFVLEIIKGARELVGADFPIGLRVGADGDGRQGLTTDELVETCRLLAPHVAYISVSNGSYSGLGDGYELAYVSPWYREPGHNAATAAAVRRAVDVPVIVTGRIADAAIAEGLLADGSADMIGMVRALIADPDLPRKVHRGEADRVRMCLGMSECHYIGPHRTPVTCAVNAAAGREAELEPSPARVPKKVVVVGAGPAGMEAARVAAGRGHQVFLCDRYRQLGGTVRLLASDPNRRNLKDHAVYFERELRQAGVELMLGNEVSADDIAEFGPDAVVVATGGVPTVPDVPGIAEGNVLQALGLLGERAARPAGQVLVVAALDKHLGAPTIAEFLSDQGCAVRLISEQPEFASGAEDGTRLALLHRLLSKGIEISLGYKLASVAGRSATITQTFTGREQRLDDVTVVLACGLRPNDRLASELTGKVAEVHLIGDALAPRRIMHATLEGARVGASL
jgi:2,4-dienoyl-CoA reductase-like NADH-dependent reductase (Old Yellow Enzyme family)/thioredoxin reductase